MTPDTSGYRAGYRRHPRRQLRPLSTPQAGRSHSRELRPTTIKQRFGVAAGNVAESVPADFRPARGLYTERVAADEAAARQLADAQRDREAGDAAMAGAVLDAADELDKAQDGRPSTEEAQDRATARLDQGESLQEQHYDSAERREATAKQMREAGVDEQHVANRMLGDRSQGRPATAAVAGSDAGKARARRSRGAGQERSAQRRVGLLHG